MDVHPPKNGINRYWSIPDLDGAEEYEKRAFSNADWEGMMWETEKLNNGNQHPKTLGVATKIGDTGYPKDCDD